MEWIASAVGLLCGMVNFTWAATMNAVSCSQADVQAAVNFANNGDIVLVPAGNCTWNTRVDITNKTITLQGAGSGAGGTKITYGGTNHVLILIDAGSQKGKMDLSGFWFFGGDANYWNGTALEFHGPVGWKNLRIHHNVFDGNTAWTMKGDSHIHSLIDHNIFQGDAAGIMLYGDGASDWATLLTLGTADFFFIEDNTFNFNDNYGNTKHPIMDMDDGGRQVFRKNTVRYGLWETHDKARSGLTSANAYEIYNNTFWSDTNQWKGLDISAGTGVVWGNTFTGDFSFSIGAMDYKSFDPRSVLLCDGTDPTDQNTPGETGWHCQYQIGSQGEGATAISYPLYLWENIYNSAMVGMVCTDGCNHIQDGRDFINNGTTSKPGYTPYAYPHPLQGGAQPPVLPQPPRGLHVQ